VSIVVVVATLVLIVANALVNAQNVVDFHGYPSNLHKCPHPSMDALQPLESWYHALF
jgi:hypothetical protein